MEITWLGHSSLRLRTGGATLITDPFPPSVGFAMRRDEADIVTISNDHPHHSHRDGLDGEPRFIDGPGEYEIANFYITGMGTRLSADASERRTNTVFIFQTEGLTLCHLGRLGGMPTPAQVRALNQTEVLFVPAGGACTISPSRVASLVSAIEPRIVVPVLYQTDGVEVEPGGVEELLAELGVQEAEPRARLSVTSRSLPRDLEVIVLARSV